MNTCRRWTVALVGILLAPGVAASADATEAYEKGNACLDRGDYGAAILAFTDAIRLKPKDAQAYYNRGLAHGHKAEYSKAIADFSEAIRLDPKYIWAYGNRGAAHFEIGDLDKAVADHTEALRLDPKLTIAYYNRGNAYRHKAEYDKALADYTEAIRIDPKTALAHNGLAWLLATCPEGRFRDGKLAVDCATRACELTEWKERSCLDTLAAAYAEAGNFDKAVEIQQKAVELAVKAAEKERYLERQRLYRDGRPYRERAKNE